MRSFNMEQMDELHTLHICLRSVSDLLESSGDMNRDDLAVLLGYLNERLGAALDGGQKV